MKADFLRNDKGLQTRMALLARSLRQAHMTRIPGSEWLYQSYRDHLRVTPTKVLTLLWNEHRQAIAATNSDAPGCLALEPTLSASQMSVIRNLLILHFDSPGELSRLVCAKLRETREHFDRHWPTWIEQHHTQHLPLISSTQWFLLGKSPEDDQDSVLDDQFSELSSLLLNGSILQFPEWHLAMNELALYLDQQSPSWLWRCYDLTQLVPAWQSFRGWLDAQ